MKYIINMNRHNSQITIDMESNNIDNALKNIKNVLELSYWENPNEGVFSFQFLITKSPATNTDYPLYFQLIRYTPDIQYNAFQIAIQGAITSEGFIIYGGGRLGKLSKDNDSIIWDDYSVWKKVVNVSTPTINKLNLEYVKTKAESDTYTVGNIYQQNYLY